MRLGSRLTIVAASVSIAAVQTATGQITRSNAPASLQPSYTRIEASLFAEAGKRVPAGRYDWGNPSTPSGGGTFSLGKEYPSSDPEADCGACSDPCRRFRMSFRSTRGFGEYIGRICYTPASSSWTVRQLKEEEWTPLSPPPPPPPPTPQRVVVHEPVLVDPATQRLSETALLSRMSAPLAELGYGSLDRSTTESDFAEYARDHKMIIELAALKSRDAQEDLIDLIKSQADAVSNMDRAGYSDATCLATRTAFDESAYPIAICATTRAE